MPVHVLASRAPASTALHLNSHDAPVSDSMAYTTFFTSIFLTLRTRFVGETCRLHLATVVQNLCVLIFNVILFDAVVSVLYYARRKQAVPCKESQDDGGKEEYISGLSRPKRDSWQVRNILSKKGKSNINRVIYGDLIFKKNLMSLDRKLNLRRRWMFQQDDE